jgi:hypothetical protein
MFEFDHLFNGLLSKVYQQEVMRKARYDQAAQEGPGDHGMVLRLRSVFTALISIFAK